MSDISIRSPIASRLIVSDDQKLSFRPLLPWLTFLLVGTLIASVVPAQEASSTSFVLSQSTVNSGGGTATSSSFVLDGSISQPGTVGEATSASFVVEAGFWTSLSVEQVLRVEGLGSGRGTVNGPGIACTLDAGVASGDCTEKVLDGTTLGLIATPDPANQFDGWAGCDSTSTTTVADDTCQLTLHDSRTVTASWTLLATVGDRVWRDVDGDGIQDLDEPGLDGVSVTIDDGGGLSGTVTTSGGGLYSFLDVPPGSYTLSVDPLSLPAGVVPSFDLDGIATPNEAVITLVDGEELETADFGYQPFADLAISKIDDQDPLPGGENLVYTITVQNLGPGIATDVEVVDLLPAGTSLVATSGCVEDPVAVPTCSLGNLAIGAMASYTLEVAIDPAPPSSITNTANVSAVEVDPDRANNSASQSTGLDDVPPRVMLVDTEPSTADGLLRHCETVHRQGVLALQVAFDEPMFDPVGDTTPGDVTHPASWRLVSAGADAELATQDCGALAADDVAVAFEVVTYDAGSRTATLEATPGLPLAEGLYRLFACGTPAAGPVAPLTDRAGNPLDGDGDGIAGGDFTLRFRADPDNLLANGSLDCDLGGWTLTLEDPAEIVHVGEDLDASADSGSARVENLVSDGPLTLEQCVPVDPSSELEVEARVKMATDDAVGVEFVLRCDFFAGPGCSAPQLGSATTGTLLLDTGGQWLRFADAIDSPASATSARCAVGLGSSAGMPFDARLDQLRLSLPRALFVDGFETGDSSAWSATMP